MAPAADLAVIIPTRSLRAQFDLDSMDFLRFVVGVNERLGVDVPEADGGHVRVPR